MIYTIHQNHADVRGVRGEKWCGGGVKEDWLPLLKLVWQKVTQSLGHGVPAGPEGETVHLRRTRRSHTVTEGRGRAGSEAENRARGRAAVPAPVSWAPVAGGSRPECSWCEWPRRPQSSRGLGRRRPARPRRSPGSGVRQGSRVKTAFGENVRPTLSCWTSALTNYFLCAGTLQNWSQSHLNWIFVGGCRESQCSSGRGTKHLSPWPW